MLCKVIMIELDNLDARLLTHLQENSRKSFQDIAKSCLTSIPTIKSRVDRLIELGIIKRFTIDIDSSKLGIAEAVMIINAKPAAINNVADELRKQEEVRELFLTSDSSSAIISRLAGDMESILSIRERIDLSDVYDIRIMPVIASFREDLALQLASSRITLTCSYCEKKVTGDAVRKKFDNRDYYFCCNTCSGEFEKKFMKLLEKAEKYRN